MRMEEHQSVSVSSQTARNFEVHGSKKYERKHNQQYEQQQQQQDRNYNNEQKKFDPPLSRGFKKYEQKSNFNQKDTVSCGDRACGRNRQASKVAEKTYEEKGKSNGGSLSKNDILESKLEPNDSDEAQITQETASFYKNRVNNIPSENKFNTVNPYPNHRQTYSDLKDPTSYSQYTSTTNSYTTKAINNGQPFIGTSTIGYQTVTTETPRAGFSSNNVPTTYSPATYKAQKTKVVVQNNQQFGVRISANSQRNLVLSAKTTTQKNDDFPATSTTPPFESHNNAYFGYSNFKNKETTTTIPTTTDFVRFTGEYSRNTQNLENTYSTSGNTQYWQTTQVPRADDSSTQQQFYSTSNVNTDNDSLQTTTAIPSIKSNFNDQDGLSQYSTYQQSYSTQYPTRSTEKYQETTTTEQPQATTSDGAAYKQGDYYQFGARQKVVTESPANFNQQYDYASTVAPNTQYETGSTFYSQKGQPQITTTLSPSTIQQNQYSYYDATAASASGGQYQEDFNSSQNLSKQYGEVSTTTFGPPDAPKNQSNTQVYNAAQGGYFNNGPTESTQFSTTVKSGETYFTSELFNVGQGYSTGSKIIVPSSPSPKLYIVSSSVPADVGFTASTTESSTTTVAQTTTDASSNQDLSAAHNSYYSGRTGGRAFLNLLPPTTTEQEVPSTVSGSTTPSISSYEPSTVTERFSTSYAYTVGSENSVPSTFSPRQGNTDSVVTTTSTPVTSEYSTQRPSSNGDAFTASTITAFPSEQTSSSGFNIGRTYSYGSTLPDQTELVTDQSPRGFTVSSTENPIEKTSGITTELFNTGKTYGPNTTIVVSSSTRSPKLYVIPKGEEHRKLNFLEASTPKVVLGIIHSGDKNKDYKSANGRFSGFYVTKTNTATTSTLPYGAKISTTSKFLQPKPFSYESTTGVPFETTSTTENSADSSTTPTFYQISSASPFRRPQTQTVVPTQPTPYEPEKYNSVYENVDNMINVLKEIAKVNGEKSTDGARPGLLIPPSASPETLHSLARYFADALDSLAAARGETTTTDIPTSTVSEEKKPVDDKNLELLLTHSTVDRYKELFDTKETTKATVSPTEDSENDLDTENSNGPVQTTPRIRQLAQVFTKALSAYLDDPITFRKVLEEVRPTEPPILETTTSAAITTTTIAPSEEDEVLNFSDADVKVKPLQVFPTVSTTLSAKPTWGYILALNKTSDVSANTINGSENLQEADSQSFVSQFNNLPTEKKAEVLPYTTLLPPVVDDVQKFNEALESAKTEKNNELPADHWIESPDATKLWQNNLFVNPSAVNDNLDVDEVTSENSASTTTEETIEVSSTIPVPTAEISYELRSLPQIKLNATQVHGLLIDFMNKTEESDKLQRILKKLNTTEEEFLNKMKQIESNPLTKRLILLLISECGQNATQELETRAASVLDYTKQAKETLEPSSSNAAVYSAKESPTSVRENSSLKQLVHPSLDENEQDTRALQLLNSLYTIASQWGK